MWSLRKNRIHSPQQKLPQRQPSHRLERRKTDELWTHERRVQQNHKPVLNQKDVRKIQKQWNETEEKQ